jgi:hypothetical protein
MNLDCQGVRLLGLGLGDVNAQYAILGFGTNAVGLDAVRHDETTGESTVHAFDTNCVLRLVFAFQFTFAADVDDAVRDSDLTSSFLTSGSSILMKYSFSLSLMLASGIQVLAAVSFRATP